MVKILLFCFLLCAMSISAEESIRITVVVTGISPVEGDIFISLRDSKGDEVSKAKVKVTGEELSYVFEAEKPGKYSVQLFHDENSNGKLDTGMFGIPTESYGFSNNVKGMFGPPDFEGTLFEVKKNRKINIRL